MARADGKANERKTKRSPLNFTQCRPGQGRNGRLKGGRARGGESGGGGLSHRTAQENPNKIFLLCIMFSLSLSFFHCGPKIVYLLTLCIFKQVFGGPPPPPHLHMCLFYFHLATKQIEMQLI